MWKVIKLQGHQIIVLRKLNVLKDKETNSYVPFYYIHSSFVCAKRPTKVKLLYDEHKVSSVFAYEKEKPKETSKKDHLLVWGHTHSLYHFNVLPDNRYRLQSAVLIFQNIRRI